MKRIMGFPALLCAAMGFFAVWALVRDRAAVIAIGQQDLQKTFSVQPGGKLVMDVEPGGIEIRSGESSQVVVDVYRKVQRANDSKAAEILSQHEVTFERQDNDVIIRARFPGQRLKFWNRSGLNVRYVVSVPAEFDLDLKTSGGGISIGDLRGEVRARTSGGGLTLGRIEGPVLASTSGGGIRLESCSGKAELRTSGGGLDVASGSGEMIAESSGGSVKIGSFQGHLTARSGGGDVAVNRLEGSVDASSSGGPVAVAFKGQPARDCRLHSSGGGITVELDDSAALNINADASGGRVSSDLPVMVEGEIRKDSLRGTLNGGGRMLTLQASGGGVHLRKSRSAKSE